MVALKCNDLRFWSNGDQTNSVCQLQGKSAKLFFGATPFGFSFSWAIASYIKMLRKKKKKKKKEGEAHDN